MAETTRDERFEYFYEALKKQGVDDASAKRIAEVMADGTSATDLEKEAGGIVPMGGCSIPGLFPS
ncbi:MAG: hypothetical protein AAF296_08910 [Pseudomonadota bacterium]